MSCCFCCGVQLLCAKNLTACFSSWQAQNLFFCQSIKAFFRTSNWPTEQTFCEPSDETTVHQSSNWHPPPGAQALANWACIHQRLVAAGHGDGGHPATWCPAPLRYTNRKDYVLMFGYVMWHWYSLMKYVVRDIQLSYVQQCCMTHRKLPYSVA